ncbi:MAG: hypothetical protein UR89_C0040G0004 [Candidatus Roizmanbacteria bacterium GW2011_GWA2_35_8]|uniref:DUF86 domain-containing protein n=1 Tax=Candidatus Roizmanbacteria bacterium GW2011_GWA2_35_8 TaxID=1618479 RepID=A0A0G0CVE1_9BACT|nr:MAG: hypothetical protein UR89_C0040G0004 [Candidatus Roizmanbacteria bacterium GW2011_GWA2_35_8]
MTNVDILKRKLSQIQKYFAILRPIKKYEKEKIQKDEIIYGAVERYLYLLCQATIDFAEVVISFANLRKPGTYSEVFEILSEGDGLISHEISLKMKNMSGFRNILAHEYGQVKFEEVYKILTKDIDDINNFLDEIKVKIKLT